MGLVPVRIECTTMNTRPHTPLIVSRDEILRVLGDVDVVAAMERAFEEYSAGKATCPPIGEILFPDADGEAHIKSGYVAGDDAFVVKIATGFYRNTAKGLASSSGVVLVFSAGTGLLEAILLDEGHLTDVRTAAAGATAAKYLAPSNVTRIGILGSGVQARLQAEMLKSVTPCRNVLLWARRNDASEKCAGDLRRAGFVVDIAATPSEVAAHTSLIVTVTASKTPLLAAADIRAGTHITAVGADTAEKQELESGVLEIADIVAVDSLVQSRERGELRHTLRDAPAVMARAVELGDIISRKANRRTDERQITIADLTGVAVQDIEIVKAVLGAIRKRTSP